MAVGWTAERVAYRPLRQRGDDGLGPQLPELPAGAVAARLRIRRRAHEHAADRHRGDCGADHGRPAGRGAQDPPGHGDARYRAEP
ncbi:hypothetical protein G6F57_020854 [Rhizopus arrhizus]|nr:hypothetical protein G6F57_020854 [Rhizopus arrhizus]KAG1582435.1 hypothetical protein G6F46_015232 [Rhizopus delemar]